MALRPYLGHLIAQLNASGVRRAVVAPGSRSTPLAILLYQHPGIEMRLALDERSAGYFALGWAKAAREPVALLCTSGTAAANFAPAVAEAHLSRVPLVVLTADRPRELRDVGAAQTIDQIHLFGSHVKWFQDLPTPGELDLSRHGAQVAARAVHIAMSHPRGPVHLNVPVREPLIPEPGDMPPALFSAMRPAASIPDTESLDIALDHIAESQRLVVVLGPETPQIPPETLQRFREAGAMLIVDPLSGNARQIEGLTRYDTWIRRPNPPEPPDLVIRLGAPLTSKAFQGWVRSSPLILLDWPRGFREPDLTSLYLLEGDPEKTLVHLSRRLRFRPDEAWGRTLTQREAEAQQTLDGFLREAPPSFEGRLYHALNHLWPHPDKPVLVASSMPVRDLDTFYPQGPLRFFANRGANGIDGLVSTALGLSQEFGDVLAILGDLAFFHDMNGLELAQRHHLNALVVIVNNTGGAIFSTLSQSTLDTTLFEDLFGTPQAMDFSGAATLYGAEFRRAHSFHEVESSFHALRNRPGLRIIEFRTTPRPETAQWHKRLYH
ncbi:2-succinyl-5-enolpyruvyl-6-hydroxy-3-cyclohexene-1-carboxylic-acid synthase [Sulfobacillus harzensis]|uniref:2-succinyl-5-enolpyruvyl-6-hydroxy-3-cyclohexene-1-carboxylate synthase n=1 Tax=Sulfobacillus harzensis TaxID=2729629 RepID=A0A7Y0L5L2_9FIRM|nr:2-succinyl-5-enolpyruvyl-6-hydroxy-3-cyclohexene-1-carboxylic-acid synthase [Sulfobacillus harzensis]NMP23392.1 2-succinyl-5-enolpyruvyl-6-hydroxy-3-cyclohexene-1-carboxylic-acid synthase [Sulfobacillus harzensis]